MFKDKNILITGSSSGIGQATARLAHGYGAIVVLHGKTESEELKNLAKELNCNYIFCDVSDKNAVEGEAKRILEKVGHIDVLVNCAGMVSEESFLEDTDDIWIDLFKVNVLGTTHFCQAVIPGMLENKSGRIVNVASLRAHPDTASPQRIAYSGAKGAILSITASLAKRYAPDILVNAVSPGFTLTNISKSWSETSKDQSKANLVGRALKPEEIAEAILFLASDKNTAITGQTIVVDGGYSLSGK